VYKSSDHSPGILNIIGQINHTQIGYKIANICIIIFNILSIAWFSSVSIQVDLRKI
jgi:hypothetical protein